MSKKEGFSMNKRNYQSIYAPFFKQFIAVKNGLGYVSLRAQWFFLELDNFFLHQDVREMGITKQQIEQWRATRINDGQCTIYEKYSILAQFSKYMCRIGYDCYIPRLPRKISGFTPHIFTNKQMMDILQACDYFELYDRHLNTTLFIIPAIIRLLYGTGLRINEALSLKNKDIDFEKKCLYVRKSKNGNERTLPLSETLVIVLKQYVHYRNRMPLPRITDEENFFFVSPLGTRCSRGVVYEWFKKALAVIGIPHQGNHKGPRLHDIRHTFAVHSLIKMSKSGLDLYYSLPLLSTCLGHKSLKSTDHYVRLTAEIYQDLLKDGKEISAHVFPKNKTNKYHGNN
jgi:integrase